LYGVDYTKPKRPRKSTAKKLRMTKTEKSVTKLLMKSKLKDNESPANQTLDDILSSREKVTKIEFSKAAEKVLADDQKPIKLEMFSKRSKQMHIVSMDTIVAIIYCSLNINKSSIQLCDLVRFIQEGNMSYFHFKQFLPESFVATVKDFGRFIVPNTNLPTYESMRGSISSFIQTIPGLQQSLQAPDIFQLCQRFVKELGLPSSVCDQIELIMRKYPVKMNESILVKNYEGCAMGYILLVLKLYFGLDDVYEVEMSRRARLVNQKIDEWQWDVPKLFDFMGWLEFVEYRNLVLTKFSYPFAQRSDTFEDEKYLVYVDFLNTMQAHLPGEFDEDPFVGNLQQTNLTALRKINEILEKLQNKYRSEGQAITFSPSLTPNCDFHEFLLQNRAANFPFDFQLLSKDFTDQDLNGYLHSEQFASLFLEKKHTLLRTRIRMNEDVTLDIKNKQTGTKFRLFFDIDQEEYSKNVQAKNEEMKKAQIEMQVESKKELLENFETAGSSYIFKKFLDFADTYQEDSDSDREIFAKLRREILFPNPCFKLWRVDTSSKIDKKETIGKLPKNFQRLLWICGSIINQNVETFYQFLTVLERAIIITKKCKKNEIFM
jgi:hypothetical protein